MGLYGGARRQFALLLLAVLSLASTPALIGGQPDFINIDCGKQDGYSSADSTNGGYVYTSDQQYVSTGVIHKVDRAYLQISDLKHGDDLRSFPDGARNCYHIPLKPNRKYLARAMFLYGNYDGKDQLPQFELHAGVNYWLSVSITNASMYQYTELLFAVGLKGYMDLCLVNTGRGTPFISALEFRPLRDNMYPQVTESAALLALVRRNVGGSIPLRYPQDAFDRIWISYNRPDWTLLTTSSSISSLPPDYQPPADVLKTAMFPTVGSSLNFSISVQVDSAIIDPRVHIFFHFAELHQLAANQSRAFDVYLNNNPVSEEPVKPAYLQGLTLFTRNPPKPYPLSYAFVQTGDSTLPPILNAVEVYLITDMTGAETKQQDVLAITTIKETYKVQKNWQGDPCCPNSFIWEGLNCSSPGTDSSRIISLDLSSSGLTGEISPAIGNLSQLQILDLSRNNLTGGIPAFLASLTQLKFLDLTGNQFTGPVPKSLRDRSQEGTLIIKLESNACNGSTSCDGKKKSKRKIIISITTSIGFLVLVGIAIHVSIWRKKTKPRGSIEIQHQSPPVAETNYKSISVGMPPLRTGKSKFTSSDLANITNNFQKEIGRGGFGCVYHGVLDSSEEVAVKLLSNSSVQGPDEFQNEALLLTRVYHGRLVTLLGYCNDSVKNLALVYEYMANGSLEDQLHGRKQTSNTPLSWTSRLRIATEAAEGLEYLHYGCKPNVIHRDIKSSNILLNEKFEAKIADFGLCKIFEDEFITHVITKVMGTFGYIDPEYSMTTKLTKKSDVYAFGVVLLELITGHASIITFNNNRIPLVKWIHQKLEVGNIEEIVDKELRGEYNKNDVWKVLDIALACTQFESIKRPNTRVVLGQLNDCLESDTFTMRSHIMSQNTGNISKNTSSEIFTSDMNFLTHPSAR